jgi:hypothetical protein
VPDSNTLSGSSGFCVKRNVEFKLKKSNNFKVLAFHYLELKVINLDLKCK